MPVYATSERGQGDGMVNILKKMMLRVSEYLEIILAVLMTIILILAIGKMIVMEIPLIVTEGTALQHYLEGALTLAIAIEFVKLLCMHTAGTLIEVLLFAIARHMIVEHLTPIQMLIVVLSIALLFLVRRYLLTTHDQKGMNEQANSTHGIIQDMLDLRREKSAISKYIEGSREIRQLDKAKKEIRKKENAGGSAAKKQSETPEDEKTDIG